MLQIINYQGLPNILFCSEAAGTNFRRSAEEQKWLFRQSYLFPVFQNGAAHSTGREKMEWIDIYRYK